jgi:sodium-dependent dicarboxylate transporter 2/3/5
VSARRLALIGGPLLALAAALVSLQIGLERAPALVAGIALWCALWWILEPIPIPATSLIPFAALPLAGVMPHAEAVRAYGDPIILLLMSGFILSLAMESSGAHRRVALGMLRLTGGSSGPRVVLGFLLAAALLSMWISNGATTLMLLPVALAVLDQAGADRARLALPLLLAIAYGANIGGIGTPVGTPPNLIFVASYERATGEPWSFLRWMSVGVPVIALFVPLAWRWLVRDLRLAAKLEIPDPGPWRPAERRVLIAFAVTALLWITRAEPFGGWSGWLEALWGHDGAELVGDETVALAMLVAMFMIPDGSGGRVLTWEHTREVPWGLLLLFGGGLALGDAFAASGLSRAIGSLLEGLTAWSVLPMLIALCAVVTLLTEFTSNTATAAILMPILAATAGSAGMDPALLMLPGALSASYGFMLPVGTAPNAIVYGTGLVPIRAMLREGLVMDVMGVLVIALVCWLRL